ncbi:MAG: trehalose-phosphatase [Burkholderiaceae bacterium]
MKHLFSNEGDAALAALMLRQPLLAFDFDGTLAPIVSRPDDARVSLAVARRLDRLGRLLPVAIITGRAVEDVRERLGFEPRYIVGSHGAEDPATALPDAHASMFDGIRARLRERMDALHMAGVSVEDKRNSIALHYRLARDRNRALDVIRSLVERLEPGLKAFGGKLVLNVVAAEAPDKAHAVANLVQRSGTSHALFVGDDVNDEPVFARPEPTWLTVRVGRDDPTSQAKFYLDSSAEVATMLDRMLKALNQRTI